MAMPMARLIQAVRVASESEAREYTQRRRDCLYDAAFIGWQAYQIQPRMTKDEQPRMDFAAWLRMLRISTDGKPPPPPESVEEWKARCLAIGDRVRQMDQRVH